MDISELLLAVERNQASDLHLSAGNPPLLRIHGEISPMNQPPLSADQVKRHIYGLMTEQQRTEYEREYELDFSLTFNPTLRFRVNAFNTLAGPAAVMRSIPTRIRSLDELDAPELFRKLCQLPKGLILVTGPTGSGKSTTLAAMVDYINSTTHKHILTIEDPVEFIHTSKQSLVSQREVGSTTRSFARALKSALREDPDVILVGELRDIETIQLAITAAETGHLVMATLHTSSAPKTIDRIIDVFPAGDKDMIRSMLSVSLEAVITQALVKRSDGTGRIAVHEILLATPAVRNLIRENKVPQIYSQIQIGSKIGMRTMKDSLYALLGEGQITQEGVRTVLSVISGEEDAAPAGSGGHAQPASSNTAPASRPAGSGNRSGSGYNGF